MKTFVSRALPLLVSLMAAALFAPTLQAQSPTFDWANLLTTAPQGHESLDTASDSEGNVIVAYRVWDNTATSITNSLTWDDNIVTKLDAAGNTLWNLAVLPNIRKLATDASGSVYVAGSLLRGHPLSPLLPDDYFTTRGISTQGGGTAYIAKISSSGVLEWVRRDGGSAVVDANAVAVEADGSYYTAGCYTRSAARIGATILPVPATTNARNVFVAKYRADGGVLWVQAGETADEQIFQIGIAADHFGSLFLTWGSGGVVSFPGAAQGLAGFCLVKFGDNGGLLWAHTVEPPNAYGGRQIAVDQQSSVFVAYRGNQSPLILKKYASDGTLIWTREPEVNSDSASYTGIAVDSQGNCFAGGYFGGTSPPPDYPFLPGDMSFAGKSVTNVASLFELFVVKYSGSGEASWALQTVGLDPRSKGFPERVSDTRMSSIATSPLGSVFISGGTRGTVEFGSTSLSGLRWQVGGLGIFAARVLDPIIVRPQLSIRSQVDGLRLSWPASFTGFALESAAAISTSTWTSFPPSPLWKTTKTSSPSRLAGTRSFSD